MVSEIYVLMQRIPMKASWNNELPFRTIIAIAPKHHKETITPSGYGCNISNIIIKPPFAVHCQLLC